MLDEQYLYIYSNAGSLFHMNLDKWFLKHLTKNTITLFTFDTLITQHSKRHTEVKAKIAQAKVVF